MPKLPPGPDRRTVLSLLGAGLATGAALVRQAAAAEDAALQALIEANQQREIGRNFDSASRTIHMPKASLPTLSAVDGRHHRAGDRRNTRAFSPQAAGPRFRRPSGCGLATATRAWCRCASG